MVHMDPDRDPVILAGLIVLAVPWLTAIALRRVDRGIAAAGLRNGLIIAALLALGAGGTTFVLLADQSGAVGAAVTFGLTVALAFLWLGLTIMPIGFIARGGHDWARYGTWAAVAIIAVSLGLGWTTYTAFEDRGPNPPGTSASPQRPAMHERAAFRASTPAVKPML